MWGCRGKGTRISIHALREEGDLHFHVFAVVFFLFLSTPSARRATFTLGGKQRVTLISIHALREEGDKGRADQRPAHRNFYPRPPRGGRHGAFSYLRSPL